MNKLCEHKRIIGACRICKNEVAESQNFRVGELNLNNASIVPSLFVNIEQRENLEQEIEAVLSCYNISSLLNISDFILSRYLVKSLRNLYRMRKDVAKWKA